MMKPASGGSTPGAPIGLVGTIAIHAAVIAALVLTVRPQAALPPVYAVDLVAAPAPTSAPPPRHAAQEAISTPPEPPAPPKAKPKPAEKTAPLPKQKPRDVEPAKSKEPPPPVRTPATPAPGVTPGTGSDAATIKTPGLTFPYPDYLRNIENQVLRRWDQLGTDQNRVAEVAFSILRDGSVRDIHFVTRSGNFSFDLSAQGAIEAAGNAHAFGPLPSGYEADVLPVSFYFKPQGS